jgi:hypothetical protein
MFLSAAVFAGILSGWAAILFLHLRHAGLVAIAAIVPAPVLGLGHLLASLPNAERTGLAHAPFLALIAYVLGVVVAQSAMSRVANNICNGSDRREAVSEALLAIAVPVSGVLSVLVVVLLAVGAMSFPFVECLAAIALALCAFVLALAGGWIARWLAYSEAFIARSNIARERRERWMEHLAFVAEGRWALSLTGIAAILATIALFGSESVRVQHAPLLFGLRCGIATVAGFLIFAACLPNWRLGLSVLLTLVIEILFGLWPIANTAMPVVVEDCIGFAMAVAAYAVPLAILARTIGANLRIGDTAETALLRALQTFGADAALCVAVAMLPWCATTLSGGLTRFALGAGLAALPATMLLLPALAMALYTVLPTYRTVEDVFGKR